jgi:uncharacterized protein DUF5615
VTVRFLADEDLDSDIIEGLRSREPAIDILNAKKTSLRGTKDPDLLELAAQQKRILISHDRRTMIRHFRDRLAVGNRVQVCSSFPNGAQLVRSSSRLSWSGPHLNRRSGVIPSCIFLSVEIYSGTRLAGDCADGVAELGSNGKAVLTGQNLVPFLSQ